MKTYTISKEFSISTRPITCIDKVKNFIMNLVHYIFR